MKLKEVEQWAIPDIRKAYKTCLSYQVEYTLLQEEIYFEVYSHALHLLHRKNSPVHRDYTKSATEQNFVGEVWSLIITSIFSDDSLKVWWYVLYTLDLEYCIKTIKRGDSVSELSTAAKKRLYQDCDQTLRDGVDLRVMTSIGNKKYDVLNGKFTNSDQGTTKFFTDRRKVLPEAKTIIDEMMKQTYIPRNEAKRVLIPTFQANGLDDEVTVLKLIASDLYTSQYIGSVCIPSSMYDLKRIRQKCLLRLLYIRVDWLFKYFLSHCKLLYKYLGTSHQNFIYCNCRRWPRNTKQGKQIFRVSTISFQ